MRQIKRWSFLRRSTSILIFWMAAITVVQAQDPVFTQFYLAPVYLNPAMTGLSPAARINANYRYQYTGFGAAYRTLTLGVDQYVPSLNSGFGFQLTADEAGAGILSNTSFKASYSFELRFRSDIRIKLGAQAGAHQIGLDREKLIFGDQLDPINGLVFQEGMPPATGEDLTNTSKWYPSVEFGVLAHADKWYGGLALHNINTPDISLLDRNENGNLPMRITIHGGYQLDLAAGYNKSSINPYFLYTTQRQFYQVQIGGIYAFNDLQLGLGFRQTSSNADAVLISIGAFKEFIRVGYSYDLNISALGGDGGTHEIGMLIYIDRTALYKGESRYSNCLDIFR